MWSRRLLLGALLAFGVIAAGAVATPAVTIITFTARSIDGPMFITEGPDGAMWFTNATGNSIGRITAAGAVTKFTGPGIDEPYGITVGPDGALWFTNLAGDSIGRIATSGTVTNYASGIYADAPTGIVAGPDGFLWFTDGTGDDLDPMTTTGSFVGDITGGGIDEPQLITVGPDGALWFTNRLTNTIGRLSQGAFPTTTTYPGVGIRGPLGITAGPDGALWFTNETGNSIGRITTSGVVTNFTGAGISKPVGITAGPDGALWFTNSGNNSIGRITTSGVVTNFTGPGIDSPEGIAAGPGGTLWFTNLLGNSIGRISVFAVPVVSGVRPAMGPAAGGTRVAITGNGFVGVQRVAFGGRPATSFTVLSNTALEAVSPPGAGVVDVTLTNAVGTSLVSAADRFDYAPVPSTTTTSSTSSTSTTTTTTATTVPPTSTTTPTTTTTAPAHPPAITGLVPSHGPAAGGTTVTISGSGLAGAERALFGTRPAAGLTLRSGAELRVTSPPGSGVVNVIVVTRNGASPIVPADRFTYTAASPAAHQVVALAVDPPSGPPGSALDVSTSGLDPPCPVEYVNFGHQRIGDATIPPSGRVTLDDLVVPGDAPAGPQPVTISCSSSGAAPIRTDRFVVTTGTAHPTEFDTSITIPGQLELDGRAIAQAALATTALLVLALVIALGFPAEWFNDTYDQQKERIGQGVRRTLHLRSGAGESTRVRRIAALSAFVIVGGVLSALLVPGFGWNGSTLWFVVGAGIGLIAVVVGFSLPLIVYGRARHNAGHFYVIAGSILVATVCVVISRALHFQPGYLYGLIAGYGLAHELPGKTDGRIAAGAAVVTLALSLGAWLVYGRVEAAASHGVPSPALLVLEAGLAVIFVAGLEAVAFGLLPLPFLPGRTVYRWCWPAWLLLYCFSVFAFIKILLLPNHGFVSKAGALDLVPIIATFTAFALVSLGFMAYFRLRPNAPSRSGPEVQP